ncbi:MAG: hypothetical protein AAB874_06125 [Patescibacteria group bacterium]
MFENRPLFINIAISGTVGATVVILVDTEWLVSFWLVTRGRIL